MKYKNKLSLIFAIVFLILGIISIVLLVKYSIVNTQLTDLRSLRNMLSDAVNETENDFKLMRDSGVLSESTAVDTVLTYMIYKANIHNQQIFIISMSLLSTLSFLIAIYFGIKTILSYKVSKKSQLTAV